MILELTYLELAIGLGVPFLLAFVSTRYIFPPLLKDWSDAIFFSIMIAGLTFLFMHYRGDGLGENDKPYTSYGHYELYLLELIVLPSLFTWGWKRARD